MDSRERILTALNNKIPDRVPIFELLIDEISVVKLARIMVPERAEVKGAKTRFGEESNEVLDLYCSIIEILDIDATTTNFSVGLEEIGQDKGKDKFGVIYHLSEYGEPYPVAGVINDITDCKNLNMVKKLNPSDFRGVKYVISRFGKTKAHFLNILDPFKLSWRLRGGMQNLLMDYIINPKLVHKLAEITTDYDKAAIRMAQSLGIDVIAVPGDLAGEETTIMSPSHYREYIKPYHKKLVDFAHSLGLKIIKHSDGNIWSILDDIIDVGFDGVHPIQPQCMDIGEVKKYINGRACILGNIDCRNLLPYGSKEEVEKTVRETIEVVASGGGYIISSSNSIHPEVKPENYITMIETVHRYGLYKNLGD